MLLSTNDLHVVLGHEFLLANETSNQLRIRELLRVSSGVTSSMTSLLRVLCLHDKQSNASLLTTQWRKLEEKLLERHGVELVYCNGPIILKQPSEQGPFLSVGSSPKNNDGTKVTNHPRAWWTEGKSTSEQDSLVLTEAVGVGSVTGLDASLMLLRQIWTSSPFIGIMGVGQGASMASLLTASVLEPQPYFLVFVDGSSLFPDKEQLSTIPTLHLVADEGEKSATIHQKQLLLQQFPGIVSKRSGQRRDEFNTIGRFICDQTNALLQSKDSIQQLSLQTALYEAECQAEEAIARHIADKPPSSLMAVIRPNMVALPNHRHETPLAGAPCPSEFLVARERRQNSSISVAVVADQRGNESSDDL